MTVIKTTELLKDLADRMVGEIVITKGGEIWRDGTQVYSSSTIHHFDLTKVQIKGYQFSHKEATPTGEIFIYDPD